MWTGEASSDFMDPDYGLYESYLNVIKPLGAML